jgi:hypothetical protein
VPGSRIKPHIETGDRALHGQEGFILFTLVLSSGFPEADAASQTERGRGLSKLTHVPTYLFPRRGLEGAVMDDYDEC